MKTALITGAGGWLGLELTKYLIEHNYYVKAVDRYINSELKKLAKSNENTLQLIEAELDDIENWGAELQNLDCLFHLAAKVHSKPNNNKDIEEFYYINSVCTKVLFDKALECNVKKVVFVSTVAVYGKQYYSRVDVKTLHSPETPYGKSKDEAEKYALELYDSKKFPVTIVQPVTVYGGEDRGNFKKLFNLSQKGLSVTFGNGENKKTVIYYKDLIKIMEKIGCDVEDVGTTYICGTEVISYNKIIEKYNSYSKRVFNIRIPQFLTITLIFCGKHGIRKTKNIAENIEALNSNNIYDISKVKKILDNESITYFSEWNCNEEYKNKKLVK